MDRKTCTSLYIYNDLFIYSLGSLDSTIAVTFCIAHGGLQADQRLYFNKVWKSTGVIWIFLRYYFRLLVLKAAACLRIKSE